MKRLILFAFLLPFFAQAQWVTGTFQFEASTKYGRYFQGTTIDSIVFMNGAPTNGYVPVYNSTSKKTIWTNPSTFSPTLSTLTLGFGLLGTSYNGSAPITAKVDTTTVATLANLGNYASRAFVASTYQPLAGRTTIGQNFFTLANPSAITFIRVNADNSISTLDAASFRTAIGAGTGVGTVTSIATSTGITGGTITSTGTLKADTAVLQTVLNFKPLGNTFWASKTAPFTITTPNTVANANGATISSGVFRLNKVSATSPGIFTTGTDTIAGIKTFTSSMRINSAAPAVQLRRNDNTGNIGISFATLSTQTWQLGQLVSGNEDFQLYNYQTSSAAISVNASTNATTFIGTVTSPTFVGALTGNATSANSVVSTSGGNVSFSGDVTNHTYGLPGSNSFIYTTTAGSITSAQLLASLTDESGSGSAVFSTGATLVAPALGTPTALVGTNITGTAAGLTAGNVTTNANLTGVITSVGNATSIASQTGTGTTFVTAAGPTITGTLTYTTLAGAGSSSIATLNTSAGSVTTTLNLRNGGQAVSTGVGIGFNAGAAGTNSGVFKYVQTGATTTRDGDFVMQPTLSGTLTDMFRFASMGTITTNVTSGSILSALSATTSGVFLNFANTSGTFVAGVESSAGGAIITGDTGYDAAIRGISGISFSGNNGANLHLRLTSTGGLTLSTAGKINITEGTNGSAGQTTLVAGTKAITITGITTATRAFVTLVTAANTSLTTTYQAVCTANTLTIQSNIAAGTINIADTSTLNYWVEN